MRAVMLDVPSGLLAERALLGIDVFDEMWEGELHMVPPPSEEHQRIGSKLLIALDPLAEATGLAIRYETGVFDPGAPGTTNYRVPDLVVFAAGERSDRGVEGGAALVVEIRSPEDESIAKLAFYQRVGVVELVMIDRETKAVRHWRREGGVLAEMVGAEGAPVRLSVLAVALEVVDGRLAVDTPSGRTLI